MTTTPNTLIFVDLASDDPAAAGKFYAEVFGWRDDERPARRLPPHGARRQFPQSRRLGKRDRQSAPGHLQGRQRPARIPSPTASSRARWPATAARRGSGSWSATASRTRRSCKRAIERGADDAVARSLLEGIQRLQPRLSRPLGQRDHAVGERRGRSRKSRPAIRRSERCAADQVWPHARTRIGQRNRISIDVARPRRHIG